MFFSLLRQNIIYLGQVCEQAEGFYTFFLNQLSQFQGSIWSAWLASSVHKQNIGLDIYNFKKVNLRYLCQVSPQCNDWSQDRLLVAQSRCHNWRRAQLEKIKKPKCPNSRFFARRQQPQELWWVGPWQAISSTKRRLPPIVSDPANRAARHSSLGKLKTNTNPPANHIYHLQICWQTNKQISKAMLR